MMPEKKVRCPYCSSVQTELFSLFGQQLLTVQYYCNACHTPFEYVKDEEVLEAYSTLARSADRQESSIGRKDEQ